MPVVINDFEIVPEQAPASDASSGTATTATAQASVAAPLSPLEVEHVLRFHVSRILRVAAD